MKAGKWPLHVHPGVLCNVASFPWPGYITLWRDITLASPPAAVDCLTEIRQDPGRSSILRRESRWGQPLTMIVTGVAVQQDYRLKATVRLWDSPPSPVDIHAATLNPYPLPPKHTPTSSTVKLAHALVKSKYSHIIKIGHHVTENRSRFTKLRAVWCGVFGEWTMCQ